MSSTNTQQQQQQHTDTPANANTGCVGPTSAEAGKSDACAGCPNAAACSSGQFSSPEAMARQAAEAAALQQSLDNVSHVVLVISGKGGVGKSTVAAQLCHTLASEGYAVGLLDVDLCGPSAPRMVLGDSCTQMTIHKSGSGAWTPVYSPTNKNGSLAVMSISFMLADPNQAVVWRGPRKNALIQQFLTEVDWTGDTEGLDYLIVDTPPGTSDEHISTVQYLQKAAGSSTNNKLKGAIVVTTPEEIALSDVRKELNFCQKTGVDVLGVIENMGSCHVPLRQLTFTKVGGTGAYQTGGGGSDENDSMDTTENDDNNNDDDTEYVLNTIKEKCPELMSYMVSIPLFAASVTAAGGGGASSATRRKTTPTEQMAEDYKVPFWGRLPLDLQLLKACEHGQSFVDTVAAGDNGANSTTNNAAYVALKQFTSRLTKTLPVDME